jgi:murein DD-endopeptidase MepM/ murein hydrolase activator NlpD
MRSFVLTVKSSLMIGLAGVLLAGCSSSIDRFADYPGESDRTHTASTPRGSGSASSDDYIESSTLSSAPVRSSGSNPYATTYKPPIYNSVQTYNEPQAYGEPTQAYDEPRYYDESRADRPSAVKGRTIIVEPGQTLYSIARAHGMRVADLASANGLRAPYDLQAGQRLKVQGSGEPRAIATNAPAQHNFSQKSGVHTVRSGETLFALGRRYGVHPYKIADHNDLPHDVSLRTGQKVRIPGAKWDDRVEENDDSSAQDDYASNAEDQYGYDDSREQAGKADGDSEDDVASAPDDEEQQQQANDQGEENDFVSDETSGSFRWPVKGRVISKYGSKPGGTRNEGINIAVPEGTSVRAAESGVVAYAGNELKGYGNLVLIRHDGGWVTAYAHNKQLFVKRGDTVRRGDVIAKAGQTGSVDSPQLHFELRKGATAVDPLKYLSSSQAASY